MKRTLVTGALLSMLLPAHAFAYLPGTFKTKQNCDPPAQAVTLRRSRRLILGDKLALLDTNRAQPSGLLSYVSREHGLSLRYPAAWTVKERLYGTLVSFLSPLESDDDAIRENINILLERIPDDRVTLQSLTEDAVLDLLSSTPGLVFQASEGMLIGSGIAAHGVTYEQDTELGRIKFRQVWAITDGRAVLLTFTTTPETFGEYEGVFEMILRTITLSE